MSPGFMKSPLSLEQLSAMADGELDDAAIGDACAGWHADPAHRAAWHAYHLIGDVMRSDDLASDATRDAAFLGSLRDRLATEPVVLAPLAAAVAVAPPRRPRSWMTPAAVAAGFVAVAGVLVVMRGAGPSVPPDQVVADVGKPVLPVLPAPVPERVPPVDTAAEPLELVVSGQLIRDVQLDRYLAAHKQFAGSSALGVPSAFLRSATSDASAR